MRRFVFAVAVLAVTGFLIFVGHIQAQVGPGDGEAVLRDPFATPPLRPSAPANPLPNGLGSVEPGQAPGSENGQPGQPSAPGSDKYVEGLLRAAMASSPDHRLPPLDLKGLAPTAQSNVNRDIEVTAELGPYMILIQTYPGDECYQAARQLVTELRSTYRLNAYTFNKGAEDRAKEYERVKKVVEEQREYYRKLGVVDNLPIRVKVMHVHEQCAVLVGGYPTMDAACRALKAMAALKPPDPNKVLLSVRVGAMEQKSKITEVQTGYVNPFKSAFVVRNPALKQEEPVEATKLDMELLRKLNAGESLSLLNCKKPVTLAFKQFHTPHEVQPKDSVGKTLLASVGLAKKTESVDASAANAHQYAEFLRKAKLEAYVLHTRFASIVTIGGFDSAEDPRLKATANLLAENRMKLMLPGMTGPNNASVGGSPMIQLGPDTDLSTNPRPMQVPR